MARTGTLFLAIGSGAFFSQSCLLVAPVDDVKPSGSGASAGGGAGRPDGSIGSGGSSSTGLGGSGGIDADAGSAGRGGPVGGTAQVDEASVSDVSVDHETGDVVAEGSLDARADSSLADVSPTLDSAVDRADAPQDGASLDAATDGQRPTVVCGGTTCNMTNAKEATCIANRCVYSCVEGFADCASVGPNADGCETALGNVTHCRTCNEQCDESSQVCLRLVGCTGAPAPAFRSRWSDPTGWVDANNSPPRMTFDTTGLPANVIHECRTGRANDIVNVPWGPCDKDDGKKPEHTLVPPLGAMADRQNGSYKTQYRYKMDAYTSPVLEYPFYVHHTLDGAITCTQPRTDEEYFAIAKAYGVAHPAEFRTPSWADVDGGVGTPAAGTIVLRNPFIRIPFFGVETSSSSGYGLFKWTKPLTNPYVVDDVYSFRHRFVMNAEKTMILRKRAFGRLYANDCEDPVWYGSHANGRSPKRLLCEALVLNRSGHGLCIGAGQKPADGGIAPLSPPTYIISGWQKIRVNHDARCTSGATCNDMIQDDGGATDNPFKVYVAP